MAVFLLHFANFRVKTGVKKVTHREFHYRAFFNEPAIAELELLKINPNQIGKLYQHFLFHTYRNDEVFSNKLGG